MNRRKKLQRNSYRPTKRKKWFAELTRKAQNYASIRWLYLADELLFSHRDADQTVTDELTIIFLNQKLKHNELYELALHDDPNIQHAAITILKWPLTHTIPLDIIHNVSYLPLAISLFPEADTLMQQYPYPSCLPLNTNYTHTSDSRTRG